LKLLLLTVNVMRRLPFALFTQGSSAAILSPAAYYAETCKGISGNFLAKARNGPAMVPPSP
jgi:hypothetical protein